MNIELTRRGFLGSCGAAASAALLAGGVVQAATLAPQGLSRRRLDVSEMTLETFQPLVGEEFLVQRPDGRQCLKLAAAQEMEAKLGADQAGNTVTEGFSLLFEAPVDQPLEQGLHELSHPALGACALFLVPVVHRNPEVRCYEAVFNRLITR